MHLRAERKNKLIHVGRVIRVLSLRDLRWAGEQASVVADHIQIFERLFYQVADCFDPDMGQQGLNHGGYFDLVLVRVTDFLIYGGFMLRLVLYLILGGFVTIEARRARHSDLIKATLFNQRQVFHWQTESALRVGAMSGAGAATLPSVRLDQL